MFTRPLQAATMRTVIGLLAATGMRIGEVLRLCSGDIDTTAEGGCQVVCVSELGHGLVRGGR